MDFSHAVFTRIEVRQGNEQYPLLIRRPNSDQQSTALINRKQTFNDALLTQCVLDQVRSAVDQHSIIAMTDIKGTIIYVNRKFIEISGYSAQELLGQNHRIVNSGQHSKEFWRRMYRAVSKGKTWRHEIQNQSKSGHRYWVDTSIFPLYENGTITKYLSIRTDITERKLIEEELRRSYQEAQAALRAKSEFLATMSHEIRTPMNSVIGMLNLLSREDLSENQSYKVETASKSAFHLMELLNDILDFSKMESGHLSIENVRFHLGTLIEEAAGAFESLAHTKNLELVTSITPDCHTLFLGDPGRLRQILYNLINNAIKFTIEGKVNVLATLSKHSPDVVLFKCSISDTGIGIPSDKIDHLFEMFTQADSSTTRLYGGTGLGLSIVKKLSEAMGGEISVESQVGVGSMFTFSLPLSRVRAPLYRLNEWGLDALRVSIVGDNLAFVRRLKKELACRGLLIHMFGRHASELNAQKDQLLANTDVLIIEKAEASSLLPNMVAQVVAHFHFPVSKTLVLTHLPMRGEAQQVKQLGCAGYFGLPIAYEEIVKGLTLMKHQAKLPRPERNFITRHITRQCTPDNRMELPSRNLEETHILIVEDIRLNQEVVLGLLETTGAKLSAVNNGKEALQLLAETNPPVDLILMDCHMPIMDGLETTQQIRAGTAGTRYQSVPIIALTADAMLGDESNCIRAGMDDYLSKPVNYSELIRKVEYWLN